MTSNDNPIRDRIGARPAGIIARRHLARRAEAEAAYERWERAATSGTATHGYVSRLWDSYLRLAAIAR